MYSVFSSLSNSIAYLGPGDAVVQLAEALINIESVSGREQRVAKALEGWLKNRGWVVTLQPVAAVPGGDEVRMEWMGGRGRCTTLTCSLRPSQGDRWNLYARRPDCPQSGPRLLLNSHIDTVPPFYSATVDKSQGIIRGRGACDTKG